MRMRDRGSRGCRFVLRAALMVLVIAVLTAFAPTPAGAEGEPVPPFEDETWRIDIRHNDEYWLNVRYKVFPPGWSFDDGGFSGAHVTGHSGCGDAYTPMLLNTVYAAEGEHEIIVYFGGHCTHVGDAGEETKYDRYPNGTQIFVDATLEHFLPGEMAASETIYASSTVVVTGDAPPPISLGAIAVSGVAPEAVAPDTTTDSITSTQADDVAIGGSNGEALDSTTVGTTESEVADDDTGLAIGGIILAVALLLGVGAAILLARRLLGHGKAPLEQEARERDVRASERAAQEAAQAGSAWFQEQATHVIEPGQIVYVVNPKSIERAKALGKEIPPSMEASLPLSLEPIPGDPAHPDEEGPIVRAVVRDGVTVMCDPDHPDIAVLRTGAQIWVQPEQLTPLPSDEFTPTHELIGTGYIEGRGKNLVFAYQPGTPVQVITTTGDQTLVRVDANTEIWIPRSNVGPATARVDPPLAG